MTKPFSNEALTAVCEVLLDDYEQTPEQIENLAKDLLRECKCIIENRAEAAWEDRQQSLMESGGPDDSAYRQSMKDSGRGHLIR